jgi:glucuronate isomerase
MAFLGENYLIHNQTGLKVFQSIAKLPVIDPHNHANVKEIADNNCYGDAWQLFAATDHYVWEMLRKRSVPENLITGNATNKEKFLALAKIFPEIVGNPVYEWIHLDLKRYFGIDEQLSEATGERIYNAVNEKLATDAFRPQALLTGPLNVETMCSTDDLIDTLDDHKRANAAFGRMMIRPTWRPDKAMKVFASDWRSYMAKVEARFNMKLNSFADLVCAMRQSHDLFAANGCKASDHGIELPLRADYDIKDADRIFKKAMNEEALTTEEMNIYMGAFLRQAAELNAETDWVTQLHLGAVRDVRTTLFNNLGPDVGGDVSNHYLDYLPALVSFLNAFDDRLKVVLYSLEPGHQATLATISRAFGAKVAQGSAWWLNDTPIGMKRQLEYIGSVDTLSNFAGMVSDSRKLLSYGSRFEVFRRVLAGVIGEMVELGQMPEEPAFALAERIAYSGTKKFWNL